jgi:mannose-6-phosphate isomerase-like protein (cupin superfamily)
MTLRRGSYRQEKGGAGRRQDYSLNADVGYGHLEVLDVPAIVAACREQWFNQTLVRVNDSVVRLGIVRGRFHWHKHVREDEFFFVLEGRLLIDLKDRTIKLGPDQGVVIPRNVPHRPRTLKKTVMLMIETATIRPEGDRPGLKTAVPSAPKPRAGRVRRLRH